MNLHDIALHRGLMRMQRAYDGLIAIETRAVAMPLPSKMPLAVEMADKLAPVLNDVYWHPLRNGIDAAPEGEDDLRAWLRRQLDSATTWAALLAMLLLFHKRSVNMGGSIALQLLGLGKQFSLANSEYLAMIDERGAMLTRGDGEINLIDTTVNDLAIAIPAARNSNDSTLALLGAYIAGRALTRSAGIATFEVPWGFNHGLAWTYKENGIKRMMYDVNGVGCPEICAPLHGTITEVDNIAAGLAIPRHPNCDCCWTPVTDSWTKPDEIWKGG